MSLKHAILGFLNMRPFTGYDLWKLFNGSVGNYWSATHTQIYKVLSELEKDNMVEAERIHQETSPDKKIYHLQSPGKNALIEWLKTPLELPPIRDKFLVQFSFSDILEDKDIILNMESYVEKLEEKLIKVKYGQFQDYLKYAHSEREKYLWKKTLEYGIVSYENEIRWLKECLSSYKKLFTD